MEDFVTWIHTLSKFWYATIIMAMTLGLTGLILLLIRINSTLTIILTICGLWYMLYIIP